MNNSNNSWKIYDFSDSLVLEKMQKLICKLPKHFTNWELQTAHLSPEYKIIRTRKIVKTSKKSKGKNELMQQGSMSKIMSTNKSRHTDLCDVCQLVHPALYIIIVCVTRAHFTQKVVWETYGGPQVWRNYLLSCANYHIYWDKSKEKKSMVGITKQM